MEKLFKNKWIKGGIITLLSVLILAFSLPIILGGNKEGVSLFSLFSGAMDASFFTALTIVVLLGLNVLLAIITIPLVWVNKKGYMPVFFTSAITSLITIIVSSVQKFLTGGKITLLVFDMIISILGIVYSILGIKYKTDAPGEKEEREKRVHFLPVLVLNIVSAIALLMIFFIPVMTYQNQGTDVISVVLIQGFAGTSDPATFVIFLVGILCVIIAFILLFSCISNYFYKNEKFITASKRSMYFSYGVTIVFFVSGLTSVFIYLLDGAVLATTVSYVPFIIYSVLMVVYCLINGKNAALLENKKPKKIKGYYHWILLGFILVFTALTYVTLKLPFLDVVYSDGAGYSQTVKLSGYDLLKDTASLGDDYRPAAFVMYVIVMGSGVIGVLALMAFISRSPEIKRIGYVAVVVNFMFVVLYGIFGKYYSIGQKIDMAALNAYFEAKYPALTKFIDLSTTTAEVKSEAFIMIFVDTVLASIMLLVKPISKGGDEILGSLALKGDIDSPLSVSLSDAKLPDYEEKKEEPLEGKIPEEKNASPSDFDSCPAFTELDSMKNEFDMKLTERKAKLFENPTLPSLIQFVVDYARESRLHLSYTPEDIAEFTAGLGATRLSILQGMSGTGKTSLPKIYLEALMGNCEIVEVESSWKDKNELLGYYNEFSKTFTPKKFTRALYKASLNKETITFIVLDEMNLSRIEYYFSDFLSLMENEPKDREIQLLNVKLYNTYSGLRHSYMALKNDHTLHIPENVWFIGTANRDESTFEISDKVYDRAHTMNFNKRAPKVRNYSAPMSSRFMSYEMLMSLFDEVLNKTTFDLESVPYLKSLEETLRPYNISFGNRILNQIEAFVKIYAACFNNSTEAIADGLERILLTKVVSKLEFKTIEDKDELARKFEKMNLYKCAEFIHGLNEDM